MLCSSTLTETFLITQRAVANVRILDLPTKLWKYKEAIL